MRYPAQEAISHEYFGDIRKEASSSTGNLTALLRLSSSSGDLDQEAAAAGAAVCLPAGGAAAGGLEHQVSQALEAELELQQHQDEEMEDWEGAHSTCMTWWLLCWLTCVAQNMRCGTCQHMQASRDLGISCALVRAGAHYGMYNLLRLSHSIMLCSAAFRMDSNNAQQQLPHVLQSKQQQQCSSVLKRPREQSLSRPSLDIADPFTVAAAAAGDAMDEDGQHTAAAALPPLPPPKLAGGSSNGARQQHAPLADSALVEPQSSFRVTPSGQHYYELDDPAAALAALEHDMAALMTDLAAEVRALCVQHVVELPTCSSGESLQWNCHTLLRSTLPGHH